MTRPGRAGRAAVEIVAELSQFARQFTRDINTQLRRVTLDLSRVSDQIGDGVEDGVERGGRALDGLAREARGSLGDVADAARDAGRRLGDTIAGGAGDAAAAADRMAGSTTADLAAVDRRIEQVNRSVRELAREFARTGDVDIFVKIRNDRATLVQLRQIRAALDEVGDEARKTERKVADAAGGISASGAGMNRTFGKVVETVTALGAAVVGVGASAPTPAGIIAITVAIAALVALTPVVIALGAAVADLAGLVVTVPAGLGVLLAVVSTLTVAFRGFSEAIDAVLEGDPEKITEALEGMAPAARSVVREFQGLVPQFRNLREAVQQSFFAPLKGALTEVTDALLPVLSQRMTELGAEAGQLGKAIAEAFQSPQFIAFIDNSFDVAIRIFDRSVAGVQAMIDIFAIFGNQALPIVEEFVYWVLGAAENFDRWLNTAAGQNALANFLDDAVASVKELWNLAKSLFNLLGAIFGDADDEGRGFIATLTEINNELAEWFRSDEGQEFLQNLLDLLPLVARDLRNVVLAIAAFGRAVNVVVEYAKRFDAWLSRLSDRAGEVGRSISDWFSGALSMVVDFFAGVTVWIEQALGWFTEIESSITGSFSAAWASVENFFTGLGPRLQILPEQLATVFTRAWDGARTITVTVVRAMLESIGEFPGSVATALASLPGRVSGLFRRTWQAGRTITVQELTAAVVWLTGFASRVSTALRNVEPILRGIFSRALGSARSMVRTGFNSLVSTVAAVPGRLSGLSARFQTAGTSIIGGFFRGLSSGSFSSQVGSAIVSSMRRGLNSLISQINGGIASIDRSLPGSLPRIPYLATGGMTLSPTLAALSETGKREVVLPVEDPRTMAVLRSALGIGQMGGGPAVVFAKDSIAVTFAGVVPTAEEAYRTGREVGQGVAAALTRTRIATEVRTI